MVSEKNLKNQPIRNKNRLWRACLLTDRVGMSKLYRGPSIDASYQVSDHLAKQFQEEAFKKSIIQKKEFSVVAIFVRCFLPSFGSIDQSVSEEKNFKNQPIRNKNRLWRPWLLTDQVEISNLYRGPSIDASYHVSDNLAKRFRGEDF